MEEYKEVNNKLDLSNAITTDDGQTIGMSDDSTTDEIEKLTWKIFLEKLGLSFKRELTVEEKSSITEQESYQYYRDIAKKLYVDKLRKREKAVLKKKYRIIDVPASGKRSWMGGAYSLTFVYSKYNGNFILRGYLGDIEEYLKKNHTHYFYNKVLFGGIRERNIWGFWKNNVGIFEPTISKRRKVFEKKYTVSVYSHYFEEEPKKSISFQFKRLPNRWIPEFDLF